MATRKSLLNKWRRYYARTRAKSEKLYAPRSHTVGLPANLIFDDKDKFRMTIKSKDIERLARHQIALARRRLKYAEGRRAMGQKYKAQGSEKDEAGLIVRPPDRLKWKKIPLTLGEIIKLKP